MATTKIEWADEVWNPITGCTPISEGCRNCYAKRMANRLRGRFGYPKDEPFRVTFHPGRLTEPLKWRKPRRVFVCSMGDLFHEKITDAQLGDVFQTISHGLPRHIFMILTKRPERMRGYLENYWIRHPNFWIGVSFENQATADQRIPILLQIPAAVRFVSVEPILEQINIESYLNRIAPHNHDFNSCPDGCPDQPFINWVIAGPETGPGARPCPPDAIENLYEQCKAAGVPFFDKRPDYLAREFPTVK